MKTKNTENAKPQHTPGPWTHYGDDMVAKNGELIAQALRGGSRQLPIQSNRALIAAAPELLEALEKLVNECRVHRTSPPDYAWSECICGEEEGHAKDCPVVFARAAIAKATL